MSTTFFEGASKELRENVFLDSGVLYISEAWRGQAELMSFLSLARKRGVFEMKYLPSSEFQKRFTQQDSDNFKLSELQDYAIRLIRTAYEENASDIHIADYGTYGTIQMRCLGMLRSHAQLPGAKTKQLIAVIYGTLSQQASSSSHTPSIRQDARISRRQYLPEQVHSVRVHTEPLECSQADGNGCFMPLRLLYDRTSAAGSLGSRLSKLGYLPADIDRFHSLTERSGLTIISGPTGHGKSTALKHLMEGQAQEAPEKSFLSIEDPPEYPLANVKQIMVHSGDNTNDPEARSRAYIDAIAGAMRSDPDVLMIGEIRYPDAAVAAIDAALTGHSVWATLHANNALGIILRMQSLLNAAHYAEPLEYLCDHNVMAGLVYQRLVPVLCPSCKVPLGKASEEHRNEVLPSQTYDRLLKAANRMDDIHIRGKGCEHCKHVGFTDQTVAAEVVVTDHILLKHVRAGSIAEAYQYWREALRGRSYVQDAISKMEQGVLDPHMTEIRLGVPLSFEPDPKPAVA